MFKLTRWQLPRILNEKMPPLAWCNSADEAKRRLEEYYMPKLTKDDVRQIVREELRRCKPDLSVIEWPHKYVYPYDLSLSLPECAKYVAVNENRSMCWYSVMPVDSVDAWQHAIGQFGYLGKVELNGVDWRDTLVKV